MPIRWKLLLAFGTLAVLASVVALLAVAIHSEIEKDVAQINHAVTQEVGASNGMTRALHNLEINLLRSRTMADSTPLPDMAPAAMDDFEKNFALAVKSSEIAVEMAKTEDSSTEIADAQDDMRLVDEIGKKYAHLKTLLLKRSSAGFAENQAIDAYEDIDVTLEAYRTASTERLQEEIAAVDNAMHRANVIFLYSALLIVMAAAILAWGISRSITRPLGLLTDAAGEIAHGRLDTRIAYDSGDEIGLLARTFNQMTTDLKSTTVSKDYLDSVFESMPNALIVVGLDRRIESTNTSALRLLGYDASELPGMPMDRILQEPEILDEAWKKETISEVETFCRTKSGQVLPVSFSAGALHEAEGGTKGLVCVAQDISERKEAEQKLEEAGRKLLETSRQAGMAEVAASILHNVGNVLNSVNVSSSVLTERITVSKVSNLSKVAALLREHADDLPRFLAEDPRGKMLPGYLSDLSDHLAGEKTELLQELESLTERIKHIKEIVNMQQSYARVSGMPEESQIVDLMETAVRINAGAFERHHITLTRDYAETPPVTVEKHKVLQILVNLLRNAKHACDESDALEKRITLRVFNGEDRVKVSVEDNGIGIPAENLDRIFGHGFTTRKEGHGFGLHSAALAAKELGGKLSVRSDGPGRGAAFTLDLPIHTQGSPS